MLLLIQELYTPIVFVFQFETKDTHISREWRQEHCIIVAARMPPIDAQEDNKERVGILMGSM